MKMYILTKEYVYSGFAIPSAAHSSLAAYLKFKDSTEIKEWLTGTFYKVICKVGESESE
jgi:hypothetical protein